MRNLIDQIIKFILPRSGLILGFIGTLMMAFSFGKSIVGTEEENDNGRIVPTASFTHPTLFKIGLVLLSISFLVSIIMN